MAVVTVACLTEQLVAPADPPRPLVPVSQCREPEIEKKGQNEGWKGVVLVAGVLPIFCPSPRSQFAFAGPLGLQQLTNVPLPGRDLWDCIPGCRMLYTLQANGTLLQNHMVTHGTWQCFGSPLRAGPLPPPRDLAPRAFDHWLL